MAASSIPHLLILEPDYRGHVREWIGHFIAAAKKAGPDVLRLRAPADLTEKR